MTDVEKIITYVESLRVGCNSMASKGEIIHERGEYSWYSEKGDELMKILMAFLKEECRSFSPDWR